MTNVECCPAVEVASGRVVISTFRHPPSTQVLNVTFEGESEAMGVTDKHLFWSVDKRVFMPIGEMEVGDLVKTHHGDTKRIESKLPRPGPETVYNMEVWGEHVYFVGQQGLLAHNTCLDVDGDLNELVFISNSLDSAQNRAVVGLFENPTVFPGAFDPDSGLFFALPGEGLILRSGGDIDSGILASRNGGHVEAASLFDGGVRQPIGFTIFANNADVAEVAFFSGGLNGGFLNDGELSRRISRQVEDALDLDNVIIIQGKLPSFPLLSE